MEIEYGIDELKSIVKSHLENDGFNVQIDRIFDSDIRWIPHLYATKNETVYLVDIRLNNKITDFWLKRYNEVYGKYPNYKIYIAIPDHIGISYQLGVKLDQNKIGVITVGDDELNFIINPKEERELEQSELIRRVNRTQIDKNSYKDLEDYYEDICAAIDIFEIGYPREAIGSIGRTLERAIDDFLEEANKKKKISISAKRRGNMDFDTKIRFLRSDRNGRRKKKRNISASEESKMLSVKWDRNIGDHPSGSEEIERLIDDSRAILEIGINMIRVMKEKRDQL